MGLLRVLGLGLVLAWRVRNIVGAIVLADHPPDGIDRLAIHVDAVGPHIGNQTDGFAADVDALVESLREPHGVRRCEAELAACFLLHSGGGKRRRRVAPGRPCLNRGDAEGGRLQSRLEGLGLGTGTDIEPGDFLAVCADQARLERLVAWRRQRGHQRPVFARDELLDLEFPVTNKPQRHRLHPTGGTCAGELSPQHRREREADKVVECPAGEVGVDQCAIDRTRVFHGVQHRLLGDGVEHHPLDGLLLKCLFLLEHLQHVPGDGLALPVRVGRQDQLVGAFDRPGDVVEPLLGLVIDLPDHAEIGLGVDRAVLGRQVPDVAERSQHLVPRAEILVDGLGLGWRLRLRQSSLYSIGLAADADPV